MASKAGFGCLVVLLVSVQLAVARPEPKLPETLSHRPKFELELCPAGTPLVPGAEGDPEKAVQLCCELYKLSGPRLGQTFVDSCYLLALGDLRPYAGWNGFIPGYQPADEEVFDRLNRFLVPRGLSLHPENPGFRQDGRVGKFSLFSLGGLERRTRDCKLEGMPKYSREDGWPGFYAWADAARQVYRSRSYHMLEGFRLGYPDSAIRDCDELFSRPSYAVVDASIADAHYYRCGVPIYEVAFEDALAPDVLENQSSWGEFLTRAYATSEHQRLAGDPEFQENRKLANPGVDRRYQEDGRRPGETAFKAAASDTSSSETERWLSQHESLLLEQIGKSSNTTELAALIPLQEGYFPVSHTVVEGWLLRGCLCADPMTQPISQLYSQLYPEQFLQFYQSILDQGESQVKQIGRKEDPFGRCRTLVDPLAAPAGRQWFGRLSPSEQERILLALARHAEDAGVSKLLARLKGPEKDSPPGRAWKRLKPEQLAKNNVETVRIDDFSLELVDARLEGKALLANFTVKNLRQTALSDFRVQLGLTAESGPRVEVQTLSIEALAPNQARNLKVSFQVFGEVDPKQKLPSFRHWARLVF